MRLLLANLLLVAASAPAFAQEYPSQVPLTSSLGDSSSDRYEFTRPIRKVAIIGGGVGYASVLSPTYIPRPLIYYPSPFRGLISYRELSQTGFDVHLFERDTVPGGNWHYTDEAPVNTSIPSNPDVAVGDFAPSLPPQGVEYPYVEVYRDGAAENAVRRRAHRAPKPIWDSLTSNAPAVCPFGSSGFEDDPGSGLIASMIYSLFNKSARFHGPLARLGVRTVCFTYPRLYFILTPTFL